MSQYFPKPCEGDINAKVDLSDYVTKTDYKNAARINISKSASKSDLASLKAEIDKSNIDKLVPVPVDLGELNDVVKMMLLKKLCIIS